MGKARYHTEFLLHRFQLSRRREQDRSQQGGGETTAATAAFLVGRPAAGR